MFMREKVIQEKQPRKRLERNERYVRSIWLDFVRMLAF
jgi:hypothetical protein